MTDIIDIYEAMGGTVNEDRTSVTMPADFAKPFKIELEVYVSAIKTEHGAPEVLELQVVMHDETAIGEPTYMGTPVNHYIFNDSFEIPVNQVKIIKED